MPPHPPISEGQTDSPIRQAVAVVIPCFRVAEQINAVVRDVLGLGAMRIAAVYVVDDQCPEHSGAVVEREFDDPRVVVLRNECNLGVGGAVMRGYRQALADGMDVIVKIDGDGQMDPALLPRFVTPILREQADYVKGNRFYDLTEIGRMPRLRVFGNAMLSFMAKFSTGYWSIFDPTNGYTAIAAPVAAILPFESLSRRYFFETDMLFRLNTVRAVVIDMPMHARYGDETSNLRVARIWPEFLAKHVRNFTKRIFYNYFLRDMSVASLQLVVGLVLLFWGSGFGGWHWARAVMTGLPTPIGTVMLAVLAILVGIQLLLAFLAYDMACVPSRPIGPDLERGGRFHPKAGSSRALTPPEDSCAASQTQE